MRCAGNFALGDVPATIPVDNLSVAMALVSLDSSGQKSEIQTGQSRVRSTPEAWQMVMGVFSSGLTAEVTLIE